MKIIYFIYTIFQLESIFVSSVPVNDEINDFKQREKRWALSDPKRQWPSNVIYYKFYCTKYNKDQIALIKTSLDELMNRTCLVFTEIDYTSDQKDFIDIQCNVYQDCTTRIGYGGGAQYLNLNRNCFSRRKIHHLFLHALGFKHEHTSPNRDKFLEIAFNNMYPGHDDYFAKDSYDISSSNGCEFDYNSVMMVPANVWSRNGLPTLIPKDEAYTSDTIGIAEGVSDCDIIRINNIYCSKNI